MAVLDRWFVRVSRFATFHLVRAQEGPMACGIASVMMACCRMNKLKTVTQGVEIEKNVYKMYDTARSQAPGTYDGTNGTTRTPLAKILNGLDIGTWEAADVGSDKVRGEIIKSANFFKVHTIPIIVGITWNNGGGHWVVVDDVFNVFGTQYAIVNDPWDGDLHVMELTKGAKIAYQAKSPRFSWDAWGTRRQYTGGGAGYFDGEIVRCKSR